MSLTLASESASRFSICFPLVAQTYEQSGACIGGYAVKLPRVGSSTMPAARVIRWIGLQGGTVKAPDRSSSWRALCADASVCSEVSACAVRATAAALWVLCERASQAPGANAMSTSVRHIVLLLQPVVTVYLQTS